MKQITLKQTLIKRSGEKGSATYNDLIDLIIKSSALRGLSISEVGISLGILNKLKTLEVGAVIELENTEWEYLKGKVEAHRWSVIHEDIITFVEDIINAPDKI